MRIYPNRGITRLLHYSKVHKATYTQVAGHYYVFNTDNTVHIFVYKKLRELKIQTQNFKTASRVEGKYGYDNFKRARLTWPAVHTDSPNPRLPLFTLRVCYSAYTAK